MATETLIVDLGDSLKNLAKPIDFTPAMKRCGGYVRNSAHENFDKETAPDGVPWAPLKNPRHRPKRWGKRRKGKDKILHDTGLLMASVIGKGSSLYGPGLEDQYY